jgi:DNA (cytosine-5)-methyltransferase 1
VKPASFMFENVKGLTRPTFRPYLRYIRLQLTHPEIEAGPDEAWVDHLARLDQHAASGGRQGSIYDVALHLANAADHGVPQKRERLFFVGFRADLGIAWRFPRATHSAEALAWAQYRTGDYWARHGVAARDRTESARLRSISMALDEPPALAPWRTVRDALHDLPDPETPEHPPSRVLDHRFQAGARAYKGHTGSPLDEPSKTLKAGVHGVPGGENMMLRADGSVRYFTVRESARLQTFPDDFGFHGSWSETMRQLGNAVPVELARVVAAEVKRCLGEKGAGRFAHAARGEMPA